jgi:hypothetical protein
MTELREGELVTVAGEAGERDGIVVQVPSRTKVVVAVPDPTRGPVMRTFHPRTLAAREAPGAHDEALRRLIRRTPSARRGDPRGPSGPGNGPRGHTRAPSHRPTGK